MGTRTCRVSLAALAAAVLAACGAASATPLEFRYPAADCGAARVATLSGYPDAVAQIAHAMECTLQLPVPSYSVEVHGDQQEFEQALVRHLGLAPETARGAASFAKAAVGNRRIVINDLRLGQDAWPERLVTLAHEITHAAQLELSGHRSLVRQQWLVEGFAEWIALRVVEELGLRSLPAERASMIARVRSARAGPGLARLAELDTLAQWIEQRRQRGFDASYPYAWLAADFLVQRHSYARVLAYFRAFRSSADADANFAAVFGETLAQFQQALDAHLETLLRV